MVKTGAPIPLSFAALVGWSEWWMVAGGKKGAKRKPCHPCFRMTDARRGRQRLWGTRGAALEINAYYHCSVLG